MAFPVYSANHMFSVGTTWSASAANCTARVQQIREVTHMSIGAHDSAALAEIIGSFLRSPTTGVAEP